MFEKEGFCSDGAHATWLEELRDRYEQMNREDEQVTHGANATTTCIAHKAAYKADLSDTLSIRLPQGASSRGPRSLMMLALRCECFGQAVDASAQQNAWFTRQVRLLLADFVHLPFDCMGLDSNDRFN